VLDGGADLDTLVGGAGAACLAVGSDVTATSASTIRPTATSSMSPRKSPENQTGPRRPHENSVRKRLTFDLATEGQDHRKPSIQAEIERAREDSNL
jgi:hypothetical protein